MNFDFSEDQKVIQAEAQKLLGERCPPGLVRQVMEDETQSYATALWEQITGLGWTGINIPEQYGGLGLGYLELCVLAEEIGRVAAPLPFSSTLYLFSEAVARFGSEAQKQHWLPKVASGELIGCLAVAERTGNLAGQQLAVQVEGGSLDGSKVAVVDGDVAHAAVVLARGAKGDSLYLVDLAAGSLQRDPARSIDLARSQAVIRFEGAACELLGQAGEGRAQLASIYDVAAVLFAFEQVGGSEAALEMGKQYTSERYAFGRPVASFQAIKHKFANMYVAKELARSNAYYGAWALSSGASELPLAAARARVSATAAYDECSRENIQVHGGMGFTWEFDCHLHYRRAHLLAAQLGSAGCWRQLLAERLLDTDTEV